MRRYNSLQIPAPPPIAAATPPCHNARPGPWARHAFGVPSHTTQPAIEKDHHSMQDYSDAAENCIIHPERKNAREVAKWCRGGTARGFFYQRHDGKPSDQPIMIIFDGYGNTHTSMIRDHLRVDRRDDFFTCFIIAREGDVRLEDLSEGETLPLDHFADFANYSGFLVELARLLGNNEPKCVSMDEA